MLETVLTEENKLLSLPTNKQNKYKGTTEITLGIS